MGATSEGDSTDNGNGRGSMEARMRATGLAAWRHDKDGPGHVGMMTGVLWAQSKGSCIGEWMMPASQREWLGNFFL